MPQVVSAKEIFRFDYFLLAFVISLFYRECLHFMVGFLRHMRCCKSE